MNNLVKRFSALALFLTLNLPGAMAYTSAYSHINVAGSFNGWNTTSTNMQLVADGVWRGVTNLVNQTNIAFLFSGANFTNLWKETDQGAGERYPPMAGRAEYFLTGGGSDILITGVVNGTVVFHLEEGTRNYSVVYSDSPWTSRYGYVNLAGSFNGYNTTTPNMTLVTNGVWRATVDFPAPVTNPAFLFATRNFSTTWKEADQTWYGPWLAGTAEKDAGNDLVVSNVVRGSWQFEFDENTRAYTVEPAVTNAISWTSRYAYINVAGSFNGFDTQTPNMTLVSNGVWQGYAATGLATNPVFIFATSGFTNTWKEINQSLYTLPLRGQSEFNQGSDISINGVLTNRLLRFQLNENNGTYRVDDVTAGTQSAEPWINEIHYDEVGADSNEFIEVAGPAGLSLTNYALYLYNGGDGAPYTINPLSGILPDQTNGFGAVVALRSTNLVQNGAPDGIALVRNPATLLEFLSYEGVMTGVGGPADGIVSVDIGVSESGTTLATQSLQRVGNGVLGTQFRWVGPTNGSPGLLNSGQSTWSEEPAASVIISNFTHSPEAPTSNDAVYVEAYLTASNNLSNITATTFFRLNSNEAYRALGMSASGTHYRTISPIPAQSVGTLVEYFLFITFDGRGTNSPTLSPGNAPSTVQSYGISEVPAGSVWINEFDPNPGLGGTFSGNANDGEYVELAGWAGSDISNWRLELYDQDAVCYAIYVMPEGSILPNQTNGFGFFLIGSSNITPAVDVAMTDLVGGESMSDAGGIRLLNEFGSIQQSIWYGEGVSDGFYYTLYNEDPFFDYVAALWDNGGVYSDFYWAKVNSLDYPSPLTPGAENPGQTLSGGNTNPIAPVLVSPSNLYFACLSATLPTADVASVYAEGLCGTGGVTVTHLGDTTNSGTGCLGSPKIVTRTYQAVSECATTSTVTQLLVIEDTVAPVLTLVGGTQTLVNAGFESGSLLGWTRFGQLSNEVSATVVNPYQGFAHGRFVDPVSPYAVDSSGNGHDGLIVGAPRRGQAAPSGTAYAFDGAADRIDIPYDASLNSTTFSFSVWVKPDPGTGTVRAVLGSLTNRGYRLYLGADNRWWFASGANNHLVRGPSASTADWAHVVGVYSNQLKQLYVNGSLANFSNGVAYAANTSAVLRIAALVTANGGATNFFKGLIDNVQIFDRALSAADVTALYSGGSGNATGSLVEAHLKLDEASSTTGVVAGVYQGLPASSGQTWTASAYLMSAGLPLSGDNRAMVELQYLNAATGLLLAVTSQPITASSPANRYLRLATSAKAPADTAQARVAVRYQRNSDNGGTLYFDSFTLSRFTLDPGTNCSVALGDLKVNFNVSDTCGVVATNQTPAAGAMLAAGEHDVVVSASDACGLTGYATVRVAVVDGEAPVVQTSNVTVECDSLVTTTTGVSVVDCSPVSIFVLAEDVTENTGCSTNNPRVTTRTLMVVDEAGLTTYATQNVYQVSTNPPVVDVAQTGTLANASFDPGSTAGWTRFGNAFINSLSSRSAPWSVRVAGQNTGAPSGSGLYQDLAARPGQHWRGAAWMMNPTAGSLADTNQVFLKLEFLDGSYQFTGAVTSRLFAAGDARDEYQPFSVEGIAPAGSAWVRLTMLFTQYDNAAGWVYVDDFSLNQTTLTASNGATATLPDLTALVVNSNLCSTLIDLTQIPAAGTVVSVGVTNIQFVALNECGRSSTSQVAVVVLSEGTTSTPLEAPASVAAGDGAYMHKVELTWSNVEGETGFSVWRNTTDTSGSAAYLGSVAADTLAYDDLSASPGQLYYYWVRSTNSVASTQSVFSASDPGFRKLTAPASVLASDGTPTTHVAVTWGNVDGETGFSVWRHTSTNPASAGYLAAVAADTLAYNDGSAVPGTLYYYWVRATNSTSSSLSDFSPSDLGYVVPVAPSEVKVVNLTLVGGTSLTLRALGTNTWGVQAVYTTNLMANPQTWMPITIASTNYLNGTNTLIFSPPVTGNFPVLYRVWQQFP